MIVASPDRSDAAIRSTGVGNPHARAVFNTLLATVSGLLVVAIAWSLLHDRFSALDFRDAYWFGGHRVLAGQNPYLWTGAQFRSGMAFVYPALSAVLFAPTALLSRSGGALLFTLLSGCVAPATLALLRVRDWRVYAVTLIWLPVYGGWLTANESLFMALGLAGVWRWRDRPGVAGFLTAAMIALKPLLWPLALWLLATRRWRASVQTLAWGLLLNAVAWSVVGFGDIGSYLHAVSADTDAQWRTGFGVPALLGHFGAGRTGGMAVMMIASAVLVVAILHSGLARRHEVQALTLTVALALVSSPLMWDHYLALLIVPLAILRPRLDWLWFLPVLMWICPPDVRAHLWQVAAFWLAGGVMLTALSLQAARLSAPSSRLFGIPWLTQARA